MILKLVIIIAIFPIILYSSDGRADTQIISGKPRIVDGDTIEINKERIRLHGIDTPETKQTCERNGVTYLCGKAATKWLRNHIGENAVECSVRGKDRYRRLIAVCKLDGQDINGALVAAGWALAYRKYSTDYVSLEGSARKFQRGMWAGKFMPPWEWRRKRRSSR
jgi:endonuclease YncB( thermonuclease family)